ncbi:hypothetical protein [uncultured Rhodospira sp.]|uniref:hypothetical protein n=1 Tax=uncultured Rhodospira sp. TaxID=1936189 RepID=UPI0026201D03|nr:hypothetical protein [uncultured Rhodospira sp.]
MMADITGYLGRIVWDTSKPGGTPRKVMDNGTIRALGWRPQTDLRAGLETLYTWFLRTNATG